MTKNDYEVELMHLLLINGHEEKSDHFISKLLRMPVTKVKRLRYEVDLKYPPKVSDYKDAFYKIIKTQTFKIDSQGNLLFSVNNKGLREFLSEKIEEAGSFFDSSFSSNIIRLTPADFLLLIAEFQGKDDIIAHVKDSIAQNNKELPKDIWEQGSDLLKAVFKDLASHVAPNVVNYFIEQTKKQ